MYPPGLIQRKFGGILRNFEKSWHKKVDNVIWKIASFFEIIYHHFFCNIVFPRSV